MMEPATTANGSAPTQPRKHGWTPAEEDRLFRIVCSEKLTGRTTTTVWQKIADRLAAEGIALGFRLRTASSVRHRAVKIGAYSRERAPEALPAAAVSAPTPFAVERVNGQATFAATELRNELADVFEAFAKKLRGQG